MSLIYLDTETTGLNPDLHTIWEMAYAVDDGIIASHVVPHRADGADPAALAMNGYIDRLVDQPVYTTDAIDFEAKIRAALNGNTLVAANPAFDAAFLRARWGVAPWKYRLLDVEAYAMGALGLAEPKGLAYIAEQLGIKPGDHSAAEDVRCLRQCFRALQRIYEEKL